MSNPSLEAQGSYWGTWAVQSARGEGKGDAYDDLVCQIVRACARRAGGGERAAEVGCGTGWIAKVLSSLYADVWACELAPAAVATARKAVVDARIVQGDFLALADVEMPTEPVELLVSCEVVAHVADQREFFARCRRLTKSGGRFLLFTQNPTVWHRNSYAHAPSPDQLRHWLTLAEIREHCAAVGFRVHAVQTIAPAGDQGLLWWRPYGQGALRRVIGRPRAARLFERLGLGRTLVVEAVAA